MKGILPSQRLCSSPILAMEQWVHYFEQGYLVYPNLLSSQEIEDGLMAMERLLTKAQELSSLHKGQIGIRIKEQGAMFILDTSKEGYLKKMHRVCGCGSMEKDLLNLSRHPLLLNIFNDLLLADEAEQLICQFHAKEPNDGVDFKPHRDITHRRKYDPNFRDVNDFGSYVIAVMVFQETSIKNGGLMLIPKSHQWQNAQDDVATDFDILGHPGHYCPELTPGSVLFMHPNLVHGSSVNHSKHSRSSLLSGMSCVGANSGEYPGDCTNKILSLKSIL
jgi:ectoine hydroxylase-related dioxygenase (phytanoyl-CoA dioxygenase family)